MSAAMRPGQRLRSAACLLFMSLILHGASASAQLQRTDRTYTAVPIGQVLLPDLEPLDGRERTVQHGDIVLRGRVGVRALAAMADPLDLVIDDRSISIRPGDMLLESRVEGGPMASLVDARAFCRPLNEPSYTDNGRLRRDPQSCFVDRDKDGRFDLALLTGKHGRNARVTVPVDAIPYSVRSDVPIPGAELRVIYQGKPALGPTFLGIAWYLPGFDYEGLHRMRWRGADGRMRGIPYDRPVRHRIYPQIVNFGSARIEILAYDSDAKRVRLRVLQGFARTDMEIVLETSGR
jgi:hypothetical protein